MSKIQVDPRDAADDTGYAFSGTLHLPAPLDIRMRPVAAERSAKYLTRFYAAAPGEAFAVAAKLVQQQVATDYGARVFIDCGPEPADYDDNGEPNFDHEFSWGRPSDPGYQREIFINGFAQGEHSAKQFVFGKADRSSGSQATVKPENIGWIVLRYFRVVDYRQKTDPNLAPQPKRARVQAEVYAKSGQVSTHAGSTVPDAFQYDTTVEPIFDAQPIFESRIRFASWDLLKRVLDRDKILDTNYSLSVPYCAFDDVSFRQRMLELMMGKCKKLLNLPSSQHVKLEHLVKMINLHFDAPAAQLLCRDNDAELRREVRARVLQREPVSMQEEEDLDLVELEEDPDFDAKLEGLFHMFTRDPSLYDMENEAKPDSPADPNHSGDKPGRGVAVRVSIVCLVDRGSPGSFCIRVAPQENGDTPVVICVNDKTPNEDIIHAYLRKMGIPRTAEPRYRFLLDGERLTGSGIKTCLRDFDITEDDDDLQIDVMNEQTGGAI